MEEKNVRVWKAINDIKTGLVNYIVNEIGDRKLDLQEENVCVFAIEHHSDEGIWGTLGTISKDGFTMGDGCDGIELRWHDMIVEDLAMVLDYLRTGSW